MHMDWDSIAENTREHRRTGRGGNCPPSLVRNISYSGNLSSRVGQSSCSCFISVIFLIFSFHLSLAPCTGGVRIGIAKHCGRSFFKMAT